MSTQKNTENSRAASSTAKCNYNAIQYGNDHGRIAFGKVHKKADVTSSVMLEAKDGRHKFYMDHDGQRKGWTTLSSPGSIQMKCGHDLEEEEDGFFLEAINGDIDIIATNGKIRLQANDIEFVSVGGGTDSGHIKMTASESITMDAKKIMATGKNLVKLKSPNTLDLVANGQMKFISGVCRTITNGSAQKDSKYNHKFFNDKEFSV
jgi:hypothetical protein|tara:strand:- start:243 stop:860 length:618 start_codon:yes stop_codon:yes gene_type:complete